MGGISEGRNTFFRMTPDANDLCVFAVKRGEMLERFDVYYWHYEFRALEENLDNCRFDVVPLEHLITEKQGVKDGPGGWLINKSEYVDDGIPMLRGVNVLDGRIDPSNTVYITEEKHRQLAASEALPGDILITMRGTFGRAAILPNSIPKANMNAALCRIRLKDASLSEYLMWYLNSDIAYKQFKRHGTKAVQDDLNLGYIKALRVILPNRDKRNSLLKHLLEAEKKVKEMRSEAKREWQSAKSEALKKIGLSFAEYKPSLCSFSRLRDLREIGIFCNPHSDYLNTVFSQLSKNKYYVGNLEEFVEINPLTDRAGLENDTPVTFVPMPAVEEKTNRVSYEIKPYRDVKTGFTAFQKGDLLWAKITPCMQNGKSFVADNMPTKIGFGSTEFHVLRRKTESVYMPFLWIVLSDPHILEAAQGAFGGSAGQQRVSHTFLKKMPIVLPPIEIQKNLADEVSAALKRAKQTRDAAENYWQAAKEQFEKELLGI